MLRTFENIGLHIPEIMLPAKGTDLCKWSVVACDQFTSQPDYWENVQRIASYNPSTFHLIFPEIYLKDEGKDDRIKNINKAMEKYLKESILEPQKPGFVLVDRSTSHTGSRKGIIVSVDLEKYDYSKGSQTLIRATEGTVLERIPPRVKIRENAPIELPHILILIDDPDKTVIEPLFGRAGEFEKIYDFELMQGGGHIKGWKVDDSRSISSMAQALEKLAEPSYFRTKYGVGAGDGILLFAVGDGNHSLATAKAHWENVKASLDTNAAVTHPARFALVEMVNIHDEGIIFEPIHRVLFGVRQQVMLDEMMHFFNSISKADYKLFKTKAEMDEALQRLRAAENIHTVPFIAEGTYGVLTVNSPACNLEVGTLQTFLDTLVKMNEHIEIDYIHGEQVVTELGSKKGNMGFYLPAMNKHDLFKTVIMEGVLPRKTFSMGEAEEKRYYLECRKIR